MIQRLKEKNLLDIIYLLNDYDDSFNDLYITIDKIRIFLRNNRSLIKKLLKYQELYGYFNKNELMGILIIYRSKDYRPYLKIFVADSNLEIIQKLMKFFVWNKNDLDIFCKLKINNPITNAIKKFGFYVKGFRGKEVLLSKKGYKTNYKLVPKDVREN